MQILSVEGAHFRVALLHFLQECKGTGTRGIAAIIFGVPRLNPSRQNQEVFHPGKKLVFGMSDHRDRPLRVNVLNDFLRICGVRQPGRAVTQDVHAALTFEFQAGDEDQLFV